jgi:hypothetical protein
MGNCNMDWKMETRPPKIIEGLVRLLTPPVSREHVLGDLSEREVSSEEPGSGSTSCWS